MTDPSLDGSPDAFLHHIWAALGGDPDRAKQVAFHGTGALPSTFAVTALAAGSVGAAGLALAEYAGSAETVTVDRRLASFWFGMSAAPQGWQLPPAWDAVAGDYRARDGWIKLHTNAPHHRAAALAVLGAPAEREAVAAAVAGWSAEALEAAVVARGGCAAAMRSATDWARHPQGAAVGDERLIDRQRTDSGTADQVSCSAGRPLAGLRVLDLTRILAGPVATRFLAGFGAQVLRLDPPDWEEPSLEAEVTPGKLCARLDLRSEAGRGEFAGLLADADVIVHGYRPGALDGLGLDRAMRQRTRPGLIDVSHDAYGWTGPWAGRRGFDSLVQMSSGIAEAGMRNTGAEKPVPLPVQALDHATGYLIAATVLRGLTDRRSDGAGRAARLSLARTAKLLTESAVIEAAALGRPEAVDYDPTPEQTMWGPMLRLRPPVTIEGTPMRWDRPAGPLGADVACWTD